MASDAIWQMWEAVIPAEDRAVFQNSGFGGSGTFGTKPCLLLIDVLMNMLGDRDGNPADGTSGLGCGPMGWERLPRIAELVTEARHAGIPIVFVRGDMVGKGFCGGSIKPTAGSAGRSGLEAGNIFPREIQPTEDDYVLEKVRSSAFFSSPLALYLRTIGADTLIVAGSVTSGCVRATVVDGSAHNFEVFVVEDCCFDRSRFSHVVSTFEMEQKYATVEDLATVLERIKSLDAGR